MKVSNLIGIAYYHNLAHRYGTCYWTSHSSTCHPHVLHPQMECLYSAATEPFVQYSFPIFINKKTNTRLSLENDRMS